ncbi:MAG: hypothetical protein ABSE73_06170 [Planctomycetota bacterium]
MARIPLFALMFASALAYAAEQKVLTVKTGPLEVRFDAAGHGGIRFLSAGAKTLVADNSAPPLFGTLLQSKSYDGFRDFVEDARFIEGVYERLSFSSRQENDTYTVASEGKLAWPGNDAIRARFVWTLHNGSTLIRTSVQLRPEGTFAQRFVRELGLQLPTDLNLRKRVVQGGDQGWQFDTRHFYQYHLDTTQHLLPEPEHNWWRLFMVEQDSPLHFRAWRAESNSTAALTVQHGQQAAGWISEYDEQGGLLCAYRDLAKRAPKALCIDAAAGGRARVLLHAAVWRALAPGSAEAEASLWKEPHLVDWVAQTTVGQAFQPDRQAGKPDLQPQRLLAKEWGVETLPSDPPARPKIVDPELWNAPAAPDSLAPVVSGGLPLPKGSLLKAEAVRLWQNERPVALQTKPLAYWPDQSIKWLLLIFPLRSEKPAAAQPKRPQHGELLPFQVTLRSSGPDKFVLEYGKGTEPGAPGEPLAKELNGNVEVNTGPLRMTLAKGEKWLRQVSLNGKAVLREPVQPLAFADFLRPEGTYPVNTAHPSGTPDPGPVNIESLVLEESGPLRATVRLEGYATAKEPARIILRFEACAGRSSVRLFHTIEFLQKDPRKTFLRSMGLRLPLALNPAGTLSDYGGQEGPQAVPKSYRTGLLQTSHLNYRLWRQETPGAAPASLDQANRCRGWLTMRDAGFGCTVVLRNMWQEYPKEIVSDAAAGELSVGLWPESVPLMDVRRYSNYPHPSQGESAGSENWWVEQSYYPHDPFVGVSKTHELLLWFHEANASLEQRDAVAADFQSPPLVYVAPEWYLKAGITIPYGLPDRERFPQVERNTDNVTEFFLFHQKMWGWYGLWDFGDWGHRFGSGYGNIVRPGTLASLLKLPQAERHKKLGKDEYLADYFPQRDWAFDNGRWGWGNTEGLPGLFLQLEYLRTGRRDLFFAAEAMARHVRDVDMRHDGKFFGCGTRHGVQHWSDGDHEPRQTVASEWRFYHYLSGDMRCRDFIQQLTERSYTKGRIVCHADHSGRLYSLLTAWEMSGDQSLGEMVEKYVHCFIVPEGISIQPHVQFPAVKLCDKPGDINDGNMFFHTFGAMHALLEYYELTKDAELREALIRMARAFAAAPEWGGTYRKAVAFAATHAPDPKPFHDALNKSTVGWEAPLLLHAAPYDRKYWTGGTAFVEFEVPFVLFGMADVFYVLPALERDPVPPPERAQKMEQPEKAGVPHDFAKGSMQSEYDKPEFKEYLQERPWPKELGERKR